MGTIFEELIRKFNEENNEEAGEHFTPRDAVSLMTDLMFKAIADKITDGTYLCYDGACGARGIIMTRACSWDKPMVWSSILKVEIKKLSKFENSIIKT